MVIAMRTLLVLGIVLAAVTALCQPQRDQRLGTSQMPGNICKFNQEYTLGKKNGRAMNVKLTSAEYLATRVATDKYFAVPKQDRKLLVLHFNLHNPLPKEQWYQKFILFTAVSTIGENFPTKDVYMEAAPHDRMSLRLKPGQNVVCYCVFDVPAQAQIEKVILENVADPGSLVARYPMAKLIKGIRPPFADPSDPTGATPLSVVRLNLGEGCESGFEDVIVSKIELADGDGSALEKLPRDKVYVLVTYQSTCRNQIGGWISNTGAGWQSSKLIDRDGGEIGTYNFNLRPGSLERFAPRWNFGESATFRKAYVVKRGTVLDFVRLRDGQGREIRFDLGGFTAQ